MDEFSTRLKKLLEYLNVTPVSLAEKMGVQRTSFNHLLSGRNKPGFEFLTRLHVCYPSINLNWLISGYGVMVENNESEIRHVEKIEPEPPLEADLFSNIFNTPKLDIEKKPTFMSPSNSDLVESVIQPTNTKEDSVDRIIIVYSNGKMVEIKQK